MHSKTSSCSLSKDELNRLLEIMIKEIDADLERLRDRPSQPPSEQNQFDLSN